MVQRETPLRRARVAVVAVGGLLLHVVRKLTPPRARRVLRVLGLGAVGLATVGILVNAWLTHAATVELEGLLREIEAAHEPMRLRDVAPPPVPDEENAARLYTKSFALFVAEDEVVLRARRRLFMDKTSKIAEADRTVLERFLERNAACLAKVDEGTKRPRCRFDVDDSDPSRARDMRSVSNLLRLRAQLEAESGHADEALRSLEEAFRFGQGVTNDPLLFSQMIRAALDGTAGNGLKWVLTHGEPSEAACRSLLATLEQTVPPPDLVARSLMAERCLMIESIRGATQVNGWTQLRYATAGLAMMRGALKTLQGEHKPFPRIPDFKSALDDLPESRVWPLRAPLKAFYVETLGAAYTECTVKSDARRSLARVALALRIHRLGTGSYPESLPALVPSILPELPCDPFTGNPLHYTREGAGVLVWSVGPNQRDDHGVEDQSADDISFRVAR